MPSAPCQCDRLADRRTPSISLLVFSQQRTLRGHAGKSEKGPFSEVDARIVEVCFAPVNGLRQSGLLGPKRPSSPGEFHPEPLTDPDLTLSRHPARATARRLPPSVENWSSSCCQLARSQRRWPAPFAPRALSRFNTTTGQSAPLRRISTFGLAVDAACAFSLGIAGQVLTFRTRARLSFAPPPCRMPLGQSQDIPQANPGGMAIPRFWHRLIRFRHVISGSLALASLNHACRNLASTFPQRSPPSLLTTAACGGLRSTPDCRPRRALLHLSYSCAPRVWTGDTRDTMP